MPTRQITHYRAGGFDPRAPDFNIDHIETAAVPAEEANADATLQNAQNAAAAAITNLRAYIALASPTQAQTVAAVKLLCRVALQLIRLVLARYDESD